MTQKRGAWTVFEDRILIDYVKAYGEGHWSNVSINTGLKRSAKSCRFRWLNYLKPDIKRGNITEQEEDLIIRMHKLLGNRWSLIAGRLPGRTDNEIKNYWNTVLSKKVDGCQFIRTKNNTKASSLLKEASNSIGVPEAVSYFCNAIINNPEGGEPKCACTGSYYVETVPSADVNALEETEFRDDALTRFSCSTGPENEAECIFDFAARDANKVIVSDFAELSDFSEWYQAQ